MNSDELNTKPQHLQSIIDNDSSDKSSTDISLDVDKKVKCPFHLPLRSYYRKK